jgi:hypothetical protein
MARLLGLEAIRTAAPRNGSKWRMSVPQCELLNQDRSFLLRALPLIWRANQPIAKGKSVLFTEEGLRESERLFPESFTR